MAKRLPSKYLEERTDAAETAFVARALEYIETQTYDFLFPPLEGKKYVPVVDIGAPGAKDVTYRQYKRTGIAKLVTERGQDLPTVGFSVLEFSRRCFRVGASYEYTLDDLAAAQMASRNGQSINIDLEKGKAAVEAIERAMDVVCALGSATSSSIPGLSVGIGPDVGMLGLLNQPSAATYTPTTGASSGSSAWSGKTPDEKVADLTGIYASQVTNTYKVHQPNTILLPIDQYEKANGQRMGDGSDETVISFFKKIKPQVQIDSWQYCQAAGTAGADRMVAFTRDARYVRLMVAEMFTQHPPQYNDLEFKVPCTAKLAGVVCPYPLSVTYGDGI